MMTTSLAALRLEADMLGLWLDEAMRDPFVTEVEFIQKVERYGEVLRQLKRLRRAQKPSLFYA
ncbi:MAG: hypothetical protein ACE5G0_20890 [Rhodothermales bacterium]